MKRVMGVPFKHGRSLGWCYGRCYKQMEGVLGRAVSICNVNGAVKANGRGLGRWSKHIERNWRCAGLQANEKVTGGAISKWEESLRC